MYIRLDENNIVREIIPDIDPVFPGVPIEERYPPAFVEALLHFDDDTEVEQGLMYDEETGSFVEPPAPEIPEEPEEPYVPEPTTEEILDTLLGVTE